MKNIITTFFILTCYCSYGQKSAYFPNLKKIYIDTAHKEFIFGYDAKSIKLLNIKCSRLPKADYWYCGDDDPESITKLAQIHNAKIPDTLDILFDTGPSDDFEFIIAKKSGRVIGSVNALELYVMENNIIYTAGHTNNMFNKRRKFQLLPDTLLEIRQSFYYVGLKSKTTAALTLYKAKTGNEVIASIPKDYDVEVLLCDPGTDNSEKFFLVKTEFGLVGWLRLKENHTYDTPIEGLRFFGD
ncbi:MAG: hypothetical protein V4643_11700 [Bacteroidota bacterium]